MIFVPRILPLLQNLQWKKLPLLPGHSNPGHYNQCLLLIQTPWDPDFVLGSHLFPALLFICIEGNWIYTWIRGCTCGQILIQTTHLLHHSWVQSQFDSRMHTGRIYVYKIRIYGLHLWGFSMSFLRQERETSPFLMDWEFQSYVFWSCCKARDCKWTGNTGTQKQKADKNKQDPKCWYKVLIKLFQEWDMLDFFSYTGS